MLFTPCHLLLIHCYYAKPQLDLAGSETLKVQIPVVKGKGKKSILNGMEECL